MSDVPPGGPGWVRKDDETQTVRMTPYRNGVVELTASDPAGGPMESCPIALVLVLDISGSMREEVVAPATAAEVAAGGRRGGERNGFSRLDLVKHSAATVIMSLRACDAVSVVSYSDMGTVVFPLRQLEHDMIRENARRAVDALYAGGSTNIWRGIRAGLDQLQQHAQTYHHHRMFLLTDGLPTDHPARGTLGELQRALSEERIRVDIDTFAFGYDNPDTTLMRQIAESTGGSFAFVPDSSMMGTAFVHAVANAVCTVARDVTLRFHSGGDGPVSEEGQRKVGTLMSGQPRRVLVPPGTVSVSLSYEDLLSTESDWGRSRVTGYVELSEPGGEHALDEAVVLRMAYETLYELTFLDGCIAFDRSFGTKIDECLVNLSARYAECVSTARPFLAALVRNFEDEICLAVLNRGAFQRWGRHYLKSMGMALLQQRRINFKDPVLQCFGDEHFDRWVRRCEQVFNSLPPPRPSIRAAEVVPVQSMASYSDPSGGCFSGDAWVSMADGAPDKRVCHLHRGDRLLGGGIVQCVVRTVEFVGPLLCMFGDGAPCGPPLLITPWHPVRPVVMDKQGDWVFPHDLAAKCGAGVWVNASDPRHPHEVWNLMLYPAASAEVEHVVRLNGAYDCVTLAHGERRNLVLRHDFYGTERVRRRLMKDSGWRTGHVVCRNI